jgi:hypothetical protein
VVLDPSLDPAYDAPSPIQNSQILTPWLTVPLQASSTPVSAGSGSLLSAPERSPRRKGKSADLLAIEEAEKYMSKSKSRR